jgi:ABC-type multidrug transport system fused ATPase/permease subunit
LCTFTSRLINIQVSIGDVFSVTTKLRNLLSLPIERESDIKPPANWPSHGAVEIQNLVMRYRPELPPVLRSVSCSIRAGEKIGIVGRTGAGKSSFVTALFRLAEAEHGSRVSIDGVAIDTLNLQSLRMRLSIITQDPVCVQGTIRYNVDPLRTTAGDDAPIWRALEIACLAGFVRSCAAGLDHVIDSTGSNISMGQKQQLSMARALLSRPKLIVMDEASSSIDNETDALIQRAMETECRDSTCLIIAHRLNTVMGCDRIMVLEHGHIAEFDTPHNILQNPESLLSGLVRATGKKKSAKLREIARLKHVQAFVTDRSVV